ncbi:hypothetical protein [Niveispirillum sp.]|uniref:hypothetical protein n=1 Tax=Niveispirillum sp. TaxID=1917217 RepID=UPI001B62AFBF|nr:hypothetical protein [Niveispirillum sp.]MBP7340007.1 hypothetical protein [Niveispirillum sp.]
MEVNSVLFVIGILSAIGAVSIALVRQVLYYSRRAQISRITEENRELNRKQEELTKAYREGQEAVRQGEVERKSATTQLADAQRRLKVAKEDNYVVIHEVNEPSGSRRLFTVPMTLGSTLTLGQNVIKESKFRAARHFLEIWADSAEDANRIARTNFPPDNGFVLSKAAPAAATALAAE